MCNKLYCYGQPGRRKLFGADGGHGQFTMPPAMYCPDHENEKLFLPPIIQLFYDDSTMINSQVTSIPVRDKEGSVIDTRKLHKGRRFSFFVLWGWL